MARLVSALPAKIVVTMAIIILAVLIVTSGSTPRLLLPVASAYSVQCMPSNTPVQCRGSINGYCVNTAPSGTQCCAQSGSVGALMCASFVDSSGNISYAGNAKCAADGEQAKCSNSNEYITGVCIGSSCSAQAAYACVSNLDVISVRCGSSPAISSVPSSCHWQYASSSGNSIENAATCVEQREVAAGICYSPTNKWCGGHAFGVFCCGITTLLSRTSTNSVSRSRKTPSHSVSRTPNITHTASIAATPTAAISPTLTAKPTASSTRSQTYVLPPTRTPTKSPSLGTHTRSPSVSQSPPPTPTRSHTRTGETPSLTLPSQTVPRVPTRTLTVVPHYALTVASGGASSAGGGGSSSFGVELLQDESRRHDLAFTVSDQGAWRAERAMYAVNHLRGTQGGNPFGFDARKDALLFRVALTAANTLRMSLRGDRCFEPRGTELVLFDPPQKFFDPSLPVAPTQISITTPSTTVQEWAGTILFSLCCLLLLAAAAKADSGALALHAVLALQSLLLILHHGCVRSLMHAYATHAIVFVMPAFFLFSDADVYSAVALTHLGFVALLVLGVMLVCRVVPVARLYFPNIPFCIAALLAQGACFAGWKALLAGHSHLAVRVVVFILLLVFLAALIGFLVVKRKPAGLRLVRFSAGTQRLVFRGVWFPQKLHSKYSLLVHCWNEGYSPMTLVLVFYDLVVSFLCANAVKSTDDCFAIFSVLFLFGALLVLLLLWANPARGPIMLALLVAPLVANLFALSGVMVGLDCRGSYPSNTRYGEAALIICLVIHLVADAGILAIGLMERRAILALASEFRDQQELQGTTTRKATAIYIGGDVGRGAGGGTDVEHEGHDPLAAALSAHDRSVQRQQQLGNVEGGDSPVLPALTRFEVRSEVDEDPLGSLPRGSAVDSSRRELYRTLEMDVNFSGSAGLATERSPSANMSPRSSAHEWMGVKPSSRQQQLLHFPPERSVAPLSLNLPFATTASSSSPNHAPPLALAESSVSPDPFARHLSPDGGPMETNNDEDGEKARARQKAAKRRALLGQPDPSKCCIRCKKFLGFSTLCDECSSVL